MEKSINDKEQCVQTDVMQSVLKASDLRIGNKLLFLGDVVTFKNITEIREDGIFWIKTFEPKIESKNFHFKPIPLTEEWLLKFGLKKTEYKSQIIYDSGLQNSTYIIIDENNSSYFMWGAYLTSIKYVHELQNLYFALTGSELTVA